MSFSFFFVKKTIHVDAFTKEPEVFEYGKIKPAIHFLPEWWKTLDKSYLTTTGLLNIERSTMKRCEGFIDNYKQGFIIPMWSDVTLISNSQGWCYQFSDGKSSIVQHESEQYGSNFPHFNHFKIMSPWMLKEKTGVNVAFTQPTWNHLDFKENIIILPGVENYKYQSSTNINMFLKKIDDYQYDINFGTPIVHLLPLTDKNVKIHNHLISEEDFRINFEKNNSIKFSKNYKTIKKLIDQTNKCPFKF